MATPFEKSLRERMQAVRDLAATHGGIEQIPEDDLGQLDYIRFEDNGVIRVLPAEKLAELSLASHVKNLEPVSTEKPPFTQLAFTVESRNGYGTTMQPDVISEQLEDRLTPFYHDTELYDVYVHWLPKDDPINQVLSDLEDQFTAGYIIDEDGNYSDALLEAPYEALRLLDEKIRQGTSGIFTILKENFGGNISNKNAENIWQDLEKLKSQVTDHAEIEQLFEEKLPQMRLLPYKGYRRNAAPEYYSDFNKYIKIFAQLLASKGFSNVATQLGASQSLADARLIVSEALRANEVSQQFKTDDKAFIKRRASLTDEAEIYQNNIDRSLLKKEFKQKMQALRGVNGILNMPALFADTFSRKISDLQKNFVSTESDPSITITLDATHDYEKDQNPGEISGDCTEGKPLPFNQNVGLHNVKVYVKGEHRGNIYLLHTTDSSSNAKAWHLDAIQIPSAVIDWDSFVPHFVSQLSQSAKENDVSMITINTDSQFISNYDYISDAFLKYTGHQFVRFDMEKFESVYAPSPTGKKAPHTSVRFPEYRQSDDVSKFQGEDDRQIILWQADSSA